MAETGRDIEKAKAILGRGGLVAIPTETVYGLAGNALNQEAVAHIFAAKDRPEFDPLIVHTSSMDRAVMLVEEFLQKAKILAQRSWPGSLTLILPKKAIIPDLVTSGLDTVAIRVPKHPLTLSLLQQLDFPLAAPSANPFGYISPTEASHVQEQMGEKVDYILDGGPCEVGIESTIIGFEGDQPVIYRFGGMSKEKIESIVGRVKVLSGSTSNPRAPGMLKRHYSPLKKIVFGDIEGSLKKMKGQKIAILSLKNNYGEVPESSQIRLSASGDLEEAAGKLFGALRELDKLDVDIILAERMPDHGLGRAINDRLARAAAKED